MSNIRTSKHQNINLTVLMEVIKKEYDERVEDEFQVSLTVCELDALSMVAFYVNNYFCDMEDSGVSYTPHFNSFLDNLHGALEKLEAV